MAEYRFMPERGWADPDPEAEILAGQISGFGYKLERVKVTYDGYDTFQGIDVSVDGPISDAHIRSLEKVGFRLEGKERDRTRPPSYFDSFVA
ncbi:MAG: hypothetical protein HYT72_02185 [Candidatus Aenigmarchaeota archaeon]|nr:hypothetical protein [Candidatus Aenigmarchaeota archaeon]